jgi:hypothetical protein
MRLREAFSSFFSSWLLFCEGRSNLKAQDFLDARRGHAANKTDADSLAVAVVLTLEFAEIASVRVHLDHVASLIVDANHCIMGTAESAK